MFLKRKEILTVLFITLLLMALTYVFALLENFSLYYYIITPLIIFLISFKKEYIIILYLILLPTAGIIPSQENILEAFGLDEIINLIAIAYFVSFKRVKIKLNNKQKNVKSLLILVIIIILLYNFKNAYFNIYDGSFFLAFKRFIFITINYLPLFLIIQHISNFKIRQYVILGLYISSGIIVFSQLFNEYLLALNFVTFNDSEIAGLAANIDKVSRFSGFYNGDPNSSGIFLLMIIGFIFTQIEKFSQQRKILYALVLFFCMGILLTASRTVFVSFAVILLFFIYNNRASKFSIQLYFLFFLGIIFSLDFILNQLSRFHDAHLQTSTEVDGNRIMKWVYYIKFMMASPSYFITGSQEVINIRSAHNVYVQMLFNVGIFPLILFIVKLIKSFTLLIKHNKRAIYFILPFFCITMFVGELKEVPIYILLFILIISEPKSKKILKTQG